MRMPSHKRLMESFPSLASDDAHLIRAIGYAVDCGEELAAIIEKNVPRTIEYVRSLHSDPYDTHLWRVTVALHAMDTILGTYGVELLGPLRDGDYAPPYEYLNMGDTSSTTLIYRRSTDTVSIGDLGTMLDFSF